VRLNITSLSFNGWSLASGSSRFVAIDDVLDLVHFVS
jgi:hypothetical protein